MDFPISDFCLMDYDTYHQVIGGSFLDYIEWLNSIRPIQLEEICEPFCNGSFQEKENKSTVEDTSNQIFLFLLELLGSHYGIAFADFSNQDITIEQKIKEYLPLYQSVGMNQEHTIRIVKQYLKDLGRR